MRLRIVIGGRIRFIDGFAAGATATAPAFARRDLVFEFGFVLCRVFNRGVRRYAAEIVEPKELLETGIEGLGLVGAFGQHGSQGVLELAAFMPADHFSRPKRIQCFRRGDTHIGRSQGAHEVGKRALHG